MTPLSERRWLLNQRMYLMPFGCCISIYHVPLLVVFCLVMANSSFTCSAAMKYWFLLAAIIHGLAIVFSCSSICITCSSAIRLPYRKEKWLIFVMFVLHVFDFGWSIYGLTVVKGKDEFCSIWRKDTIQEIIVYNALCSSLSFLFWVVFSCSCGPHVAFDESSFRKRWTKRVKWAYRCFTCKSTKHYRDSFELIGRIIQEFFTIEGTQGLMETIELGDVTYTLNLVRKAQQRERMLAGEAGVEEDEDAIDPSLPLSLLKDIARYGNIAVGVYGWKMFVFLHPSQCHHVFSCCRPPKTSQVIRYDTSFNSNRSTFTAHAQIQDEHLVYMTSHNERYQLPYAITRDVKRQEVVISIRGSFSVDDAINSATAIPVEVDPQEINAPMIVYTHAGALETARALFRHLQTGSRSRVFWDFMSENRDWKIVVCGHSLGGAVGCILALKLLTVFPNVHVFAFSPPPIFNDEALEWCREYITTIVYGDDIVARLSLTALARLRMEMIEQFIRVSDRTYFSVWRNPVGNSEYGQVERTAIEEEMSELKKRFFPHEEVYYELSLPGSIIHIETRSQARTCGCSAVLGEQAIICRRKSAQDLKRILVNCRMMLDHFPQHYDRVLQHCVQIATDQTLEQELQEIDRSGAPLEEDDHLLNPDTNTAYQVV